MNKIWVTRDDLRQMVRDMILSGLTEDASPWAVCASSTDDKSGKKRERCIRKVKKQQGRR